MQERCRLRHYGIAIRGQRVSRHSGLLAFVFRTAARDSASIFSCSPRERWRGTNPCEQVLFKFLSISR